MPKAELQGRARRNRRRRLPADLPGVLEGQIAELCRELAVQAKRIRQLQEQADELRAGIRQWAGEPAPGSSRDAVNRGGRR